MAEEKLTATQLREKLLDVRRRLNLQTIWQHKGTNKIVLVSGVGFLEDGCEPCVSYHEIDAIEIVWHRAANVFFEAFEPYKTPSKSDDDFKIS